MNHVLRHITTGLLLCVALLTGRAEATVVINGTRVVYPAQDSDVTVQIENRGSTPSLVQVWLDAGDEKATPENVKVPFTITPPLFRLDGGKSASVRMVYTKEPLPSDKESLFWLNVLEVPSKSSDDGSSRLDFAYRTRIKVFFRPSRLPGNAASAAHKLTWKLVDGEGGKGAALQVTNPTPYYVNFAQVGLSIGERSVNGDGGGMVAPGGTAVFPIKELASRPAGDVKAQFNVISDYGAVSTIVQPLAP
ncbi:fimbrial biogenesis chaperone [Dyella nitratireducens]|uniref:Chaperone CupB2 n=1 Tax=Dyella nitratireducens TaxID=1849580 RepID=A0ABQ1FZZ0_9GAMM|nr:fimbria/pilus periplasmic chaperone [Dyella nitratireducens]GGA34519.1 chaperone CupB2 [Dyella nitratireducens]GLQ40877.1 chaperone CupB2 [Dyella nitratireducens]